MTIHMYAEEEGIAIPGEPEFLLVNEQHAFVCLPPETFQVEQEGMLNRFEVSDILSEPQSILEASTTLSTISAPPWLTIIEIEVLT